MKKAKIITICGSLKFIDEIKLQTRRLELERNCVLSLIYPTNEDKDAHTEEEHKILVDMHKQKIEMSDAIFVVNVNGYIGDGTREEIEVKKLKQRDYIL